MQEDCHHEQAAAREGSAFAARASVSPAETGSGMSLAAGRGPEGPLYPGMTMARPTRIGTTLRMTLTLLTLCLALCASAAAQNITGSVTNGTTGKPAAGEEVTLLSLSQGMQEVGNTKTDAQGHFSFPPAKEQGPHMVRVTHQGVGYFPQSGPLMPGATTTELTIYDSAKKIDSLSQTVEVDRLQTEGKQLQGIALYAVSNKSEPPRTLADDKGTFEIVLPDAAEIDSAQAKGPGGQPIATEAIPGSTKGQFFLSYPLRPGETQFQVAYHMPYSGEASFSPKVFHDIQHFVVMMPKSISFSAKDSQQYQHMTDPQMADPNTTVMVATGVKPGQDLSYRISGSGVFQADNQQGGQSGDASGGMGGGGSQAAANDNRPGGGLGAPIDAPDPLHSYRVYILGAFALILVMGGAYIVSRSNHPHPATASAGKVEAGSPEAAAAFADFVEPSAPARDRNALLLEAMKEQLFQLELDRQQGKISPDEYAKAKAALDETIKRALSRGKAS
jgi:Carboxypeptidase regulatory-like domain